MSRRRSEVNEYGDENGEELLEESTASADTNENSIIGKMRSSVSSILPNRLSKWFSPSSNNNNNNDSANGSFDAIKRTRSEMDDACNMPHATTIQRRSKIMRRTEVSGYPVSVDDEGDNEGNGEDGEGDDLEDDEAAEESNHSDDIPQNTASANVQRKRNLNLSLPFDADQTPSKRSRLTLDTTMLPSRSFVASTPAVNVQRNSGKVNNHFGHLNLYSGANRKELGYNCYGSSTTAPNFENQNATPDIIDLIPIPMSNADSDIMSIRKGNQRIETDAPRSRGFLDIPPTTTTQLEYPKNSVLPSFKRQSLNSIRSSLGATDSRQNVDIKNNNHKTDTGAPQPALALDEALLESQTYNGSVQQNIQNGATVFEDEMAHRSVTDSEVEDADTVGELPTKASMHSTLNAGMTSQRAASTGLFNMSSGNSRCGSRTSSFGNGLNFYTHLEGRKSLFVGNRSGTRTNMGNPLNSSTHSLNSLSRRQFNASIYGSTSALSDSRLLDTSSPFYKGNTTYGGAAAYSKYTTSLGSSSRLTPTLIRPTSSLSTLSSSSNSIAAGAVISNTHGEHNPAISGTAKTLLDLLNGFTTPLSEAKKMASNLRNQPPSASTSHGNKSKRLSEADLKPSRLMRLQRVRSPYMRPAVMLQPKNLNNESQKPPIRELQVPSMAQLLQMKKFQNLTERSRQINMEKSKNPEYSINAGSSKTISADSSTETIKSALNIYTLPSTDDTAEPKDNFDNDCKGDFKQTKHVNKIKNRKISSPARGIPEMADESPPVPINYPNIEFPKMAEMPKIDIELPTSSRMCNIQPPGKKNIPTIVEKPLKENNSTHIEDNYIFSAPIKIGESSSLRGIEPANITFNFSKPLPILRNDSPQKIMQPDKQSEIGPISSPGSYPMSKPDTPTSVPTLKTGSVLDALKQPFLLPKPTLSSSHSSETITPTTNVQPKSSFGSQFQKAANEWVCDVCMIRNKENVQKCVACENPQKNATTSTAKTEVPLSTSTSVTTTTGFGDQFKKQSGEWECDTCMVRNKPDLDKCVSCETARKTVAKTTSQTDVSKPFGQSIFGNPLSSKPTSSTSTVTVASDSGFKSLAAAQQASKWECVACMTRNDSTRSKCVCCDQPKPGSESQKENAPSFNFGATAASKFTFGFSGSAPDPAKEKSSENKSAKSTLNTTGDLQKQADGNTTTSKGFTFGAPSVTAANTQSTSFNFGFQTKSDATQEKPSTVIGKDTSDGSTKGSSFSFGFGSTASTKANTTVTSTTTKNETLTTSTATTSTTIATTTAATTSSTAATFTLPKVPSFSFGNTPISTTSNDMSSTKPKQQEGLGFASAFQTPTTNPVSSTLTMVSSSSTTNMSSATTTTTTPASKNVSSSVSTSSAPGPSNPISSPFNFGVVSTSATSTTTTVKPMFSFGTPPAPAASMGNVVSSSTTGSSNENNTNKSSGGIGFTFTNSTPSAFTSTSNVATTSPFAINPNPNSFAAFGSPSTNLPTTNSITSTTTAAPTFGSFNFASSTSKTTPKTESGNLFGTLTSSKTQEEAKPFASSSLIFGNATAQSADPKTTTSNNTWPKNTFLFGSPAAPNTEPATKAPFSSLKTENSLASNIAPANNNQNATTSIFGSIGGVSSSAPNFGNSNAASTVIFGTGSSSTQPSANATNLFGSNNNNNNTTTIPQFSTIGSNQTTMLGNNSAANTASPAFGGTAPVSFGGFGTAAATVSATSTSNSEVSTQPAAATPFAFGAPQTQTASSGFNFGTSATVSKPAFNFTSTNQPAFNFTGNSAETTQNSTRPFQFGATAAPSFNAPSVFSFGSAPSTEATSNTSFQFNAGLAPTTSNIFAPAPTSSTTPQAARRKVRIPTRRHTPR